MQALEHFSHSRIQVLLHRLSRSSSRLKHSRPPYCDRARSASSGTEHRSAGVLTWALLHKIEGEVLADVAATGNHSKRILDMIRAPAALDYPKDDRPASFDGHDFVPIVFGAIEDAWPRVN